MIVNLLAGLGVLFVICVVAVAAVLGAAELGLRREGLRELDRATGDDGDRSLTGIPSAESWGHKSEVEEPGDEAALAEFDEYVTAEEDA